jgi:uncharacterized membrane protein YfhO
MINKIKKIFENKFVNILFRYTLCFSVIMGFICFIFISNHMNFIWTQLDGLNQHFITLNYFKNVLYNFIKYRSFDTFTWNIGFGMDMFGNLAYYIIGDLFSYISVFIPHNYLKYLYFILVPVRLYFVGISFLVYCRHRKIVNISAIIGSLVYTFCGFALISSVRHPYFINAMIVFPISMIGIEKFILEDKKILYIFSVYFMLFVSFYFGYMNALVIAIYGIILCFNNYKKDYKKIFYKLISALLYAFVGIIISSFVLLPTIYQFLNSSRTDVIADISYSINYYRSLLSSITTSSGGETWSVINVSSIVLFSVPLIIKHRRKNIELFILAIILCLPLVFSSCSYVISGFSYPSNRYVYMLIFILTIEVVLVLKEKVLLDIRQYLIILVIYLFFLVWLNTGINASLLGSLIALFLIILVYLYKDKFVYRNKSYVLKAINVIVILDIMFNVYYLCDVNYGNYVSEFMENSNLEYSYNTINGSINEFSESIDYIKNEDKDFYRIAKSSDDLWNLGLLKDYNSINYFYSINSNLYKELSDDLNNSEASVSEEIKEFDNRVKITSLLGIKYFISGNKSLNLYGYDLIKEYNGTYVYKNKYSTHFATMYTKCISTKDYNKFNSLEKEDALIKYYISSDCDNSDVTLSDINKIDYDTDTSINNNLILDSNTGNKIKLHLKDNVTGELYLKIDNISYKEFSLKYNAENQYVRDVDKNRYLALNKWYVEDNGFIVKASTDTYTNSEQIYDDNYNYYSGDNDILINLGYYNNYDGDVEIELSKYGKYKFDNIEIYSVSMDDYENYITSLNKSNFKLGSYGDNYINGQVDLEEDGVLNFSTNYNKGWKVKVDGKRVDTFNNKYFLAINIKKGKHKIELEYTIPYMKEGLILSLIGLCLYIIIILRTFIMKKYVVIKNVEKC